MFRRQSNARWLEEKKLFAHQHVLVSGKRRLFQVPDSAFLALVREQMQGAVPIGTDATHKRWWMYKDNFYIEDEGIGPSDATVLAEADLRRRQRRVEGARVLAHVTGLPVSRSSIPVEVRQAVWQRDRGRCVLCQTQADLQFDHIIPVAMGGGNNERNLQLLCGKCNRIKGATLG